jgi:hypothetical protein
VSIKSATQSDARFFKHNPNRSYRIRLADPAEIAIESKRKEPVPDGFRVYAIVRQLRPGVRSIAFMLAIAGDEPDTTDEKAKTLFEIATPTAATLH